MKRTLKLFGFIVFYGLSVFTAQAGTLVCSGTVEELSYHSPNRLMLRLSTMNTLVFFCDTDSEWTVSGTGYKTSPGACKALYSTFLSAKMSKKPITSMYFDGDDVPGTCDGWGAWKTTNIRFYTFL